MSSWICVDDICIPSDENDWEELVAFADAIAEQEPIDIVRCKECVKANTKDCSHSYWDDDWGEWHTDYKGDDWFCADGERSSE